MTLREEIEKIVYDAYFPASGGRECSQKAAKELEALFEKRMKLLCDKFDEKYGDYPEHAYEGKAVFEFFKNVVEGEVKK